jgi:glycosyltransferase involved in cell wall biosynthesis
VKIAGVTISVIIPCYNVENYIKENLDSVFSQDSLPIEVICVDDGSTDNTLSIIESYQQRFPGVVTLLKNATNKGAPYSRNLGMKNSSGEYVQFLDADDIIYKNKFSHQAELIAKADQHPDIVVGSFTKKYLDGSEKEYINEPIDKWVALIGNKIGVTSANLFKKSKVEEVGGWSENLKSSQEYDLMFRMMQKNATVLFDTFKVNYNRERPSGSITKSDPKEKWKRYINLRIQIYEYLLSNDQLTKERENVFLLNMMSAVRILYRYSRKDALQLYEKYLHGKSMQDQENNLNRVYKFLYNLFGFDAAQRITLLLKGEKVHET